MFPAYQSFLADDSGASEAPEPCQQHNHTFTTSRFPYFPFSVSKIYLERFSGLQVSDSARLEVRDNTFLNVESASLDIVNVDHVEVVGNAFSQNAIKVIIFLFGIKTNLNCSGHLHLWGVQSLHQLQPSDKRAHQAGVPGFDNNTSAFDHHGKEDHLCSSDHSDGTSPLLGLK